MEERKTIHVVLTAPLLALLDAMAEQDRGEEAKPDRSRVLRALIRKDAERRAAEKPKRRGSK